MASIAAPHLPFIEISREKDHHLSPWLANGQVTRVTGPFMLGMVSEMVLEQLLIWRILYDNS